MPETGEPWTGSATGSRDSRSMARNLRFIILNSDEVFGIELRTVLSRVRGVKVVAEVEEPALLGQAVKQFPVDVVWVNLDPVPESVLPLIGEVAGADTKLVFFATSASTDGQLILQAMRTGVREFLPKPIDLKTLSEAIGKIASQAPEEVPQGQVITVMGAAGGVGATTLASNLAVELSLLDDSRVVLTDLDYRFGQVATLFDLEPKYTLADLCNSPEQLEPSVISRALSKHSSGVYILSRPTSLAQAETITAASCVGLLSNLAQMHSYVVADGPTRFDPSGQAVLNSSDATLLVMQLLVPHVRNALRLLESMRENGHPLTRVRVVCNRLGRDSGHLSVDDVASTLGLPVFATIPDDWPAVSGAINLGEPLASHSPKSKVRLAMQEIARRLHTPPSDADDHPERKKGLIGRIFASSSAS